MSSNSNTTTRSSDDKVKTSRGKSRTEQLEFAKAEPEDYLFEKELINKRNKHIHIMDTFMPSRNTHHLSAKFHARHEQPPENVAAFLPFVYGSTCKRDTEASVYGWMPEIINRTDFLKELNFVHAPKQRCCLTVFGEKLESDRANGKTIF